MTKKGLSPVQAAKKERRARNGELIEVRDASQGRGRGLFAKVDFSPRELICGLTGDEEVLRGTPAELEALVQSRPDINDYCSNGPHGTFLVPRDVRAVGWHLANHSCNPNAEIRTEVGEGLRARLPIKAGDELTVWYGWSKREVQCLCGEPNCTGWIGLPLRAVSGGFRWVDEDVQRLVRSAASVRNYDGIRTVIKSLRSLGKTEDFLREYLLKVLGQFDGLDVVDTVLPTTRSR